MVYRLESGRKHMVLFKGVIWEEFNRSIIIKEGVGLREVL